MRRIKVYVEALPVTLSQAMHRVARALTAAAPDTVEVVRDAAEADLQVLHTICPGAVGALKANRYAMIQYCLNTAGGTEQFAGLWGGAEVVWSYFDIAELLPSSTRFYHAPLGVDAAFRSGPTPRCDRDIDVVTSGYTDGHGAEAISEVWEAAYRTGCKAIHLGPREIEGWAVPEHITFENVHGISDEELAALYGRARFVSGLRRVEGFELPAAEGLLCGARPLVFDRMDMHWYRGTGSFVHESAGEILVEQIADVLVAPWQPVGESEWEAACNRFSWERVATGFWEAML